MFDELLGIAARTGLDVRTRSFRAKPSNKVPFAGGLCTVLGKQLVLLNLNATPIERSVALADALASLDLGELSISSGARRILSERGRSRSGLVEPEAAPGPGLAKTLSVRKKKPQQR